MPLVMLALFAFIIYGQGQTDQSTDSTDQSTSLLAHDSDLNKISSGVEVSQATIGLQDTEHQSQVEQVGKDYINDLLNKAENSYQNGLVLNEQSKWEDAAKSFEESINFYEEAIKSEPNLISLGIKGQGILFEKQIDTSPNGINGQISMSKIHLDPAEIDYQIVLESSDLSSKEAYLPNTITVTYSINNNVYICYDRIKIDCLDSISGSGERNYAQSYIDDQASKDWLCDKKKRWDTAVSLLGLIPYKNIGTAIGGAQSLKDLTSSCAITYDWVANPSYPYRNIKVLNWIERKDSILELNLDSILNGNSEEEKNERRCSTINYYRDIVTKSKSWTGSSDIKSVRITIPLKLKNSAEKGDIRFWIESTGVNSIEREERPGEYVDRDRRIGLYFEDEDINEPAEAFDINKKIDEANAGKALALDHLKGTESTNGKEVKFPDPNLEAAIRAAINKPEGSIDDADLKELTSFFAVRDGIRDITGLEYCSNLVKLTMEKNQITDISPLSSLTNLEELDLIDNQVTDLSPLSRLKNLKVLFLSHNQIKNVSPLSELTDLKELYLDYNPIIDVSPLNGLTNLNLVLDEGLNKELHYVSQLPGLDPTHISFLSEV